MKNRKKCEMKTSRGKKSTATLYPGLVALSISIKDWQRTKQLWDNKNKNKKKLNEVLTDLFLLRASKYPVTIKSECDLIESD